MAGTTSCSESLRCGTWCGADWERIYYKLKIYNKHACQVRALLDLCNRSARARVVLLRTMYKYEGKQGAACSLQALNRHVLEHGWVALHQRGEPENEG
jgi:hypothetical protein